MTPSVADALADELLRAGYKTIAFLETRHDGAPPDAPNAVRLAGQLGYSNAVVDRLVDLADEPVELDLGSTVGREQVGKTWLSADFRVVLGKNRTHRRCLYWGAIPAILGCYARSDRLRALSRGGRTLAESAVLLADRVPAHFAVLDGWVSGDGRGDDEGGGRATRTQGVLAGEDPLAVDWLAGELMGLNPALNPFVREALLRWGPLHLKRYGNLTPWAGWRNVRPLGAALAQVGDDFKRRRRPVDMVNGASS